jgi:hypothetical protein
VLERRGVVVTCSHELERDFPDLVARGSGGELDAAPGDALGVLFAPATWDEPRRLSRIDRLWRDDSGRDHGGHALLSACSGEASGLRAGDGFAVVSPNEASLPRIVTAPYTRSGWRGRADGSSASKRVYGGCQTVADQAE